MEEDSQRPGSSETSLGKRKATIDAKNMESLSDIVGEAGHPASVGSDGDLDLLDEDLHRSRESRETGYIGRNSEVQWLRSLQNEIATSESEPYGLPYGPVGSTKSAVDQRSEARHVRKKRDRAGRSRPVTETTFYLDNESLELEVTVDPHEIPPLDQAAKLFRAYMKTIHSSFPIISHAFQDQFERFCEATRLGNTFPVPDKWLAKLNLIFAIGVRYAHDYFIHMSFALLYAVAEWASSELTHWIRHSQLVNTEWISSDQDHTIFMTRAVRLLAQKNSLLVTAPDLAHIESVRKNPVKTVEDTSY
jgi:hypothetical protein